MHASGMDTLRGQEQLKAQFEKMRKEKAEIEAEGAEMEAAFLEERRQRTERENALHQTARNAQAAGPTQVPEISQSGLSPFTLNIQQANQGSQTGFKRETSTS